MITAIMGCITIDPMSPDLPFVDEHRRTIHASADAVWTALRRYADASLRLGGPLAVVLGTVPRAGFAVVEVAPPRRLELAGRHRFSRYRLVFELTDGPDGGTVLAARTFAAFPGPHGRLYRALVIGTPAHRIAVRRMLYDVASTVEG
jgi:hypothetical protein